MSEQHTPEPWRVGIGCKDNNFIETQGPHEVISDTEKGPYVLAACNVNFYDHPCDCGLDRLTTEIEARRIT